MELAIALGIIAGIIDTWANVLYIKCILKNEGAPKITSWGLWSFLAVLLCASYILMTGDWIKCILSVFATTACVLTFIFIIFKGRFNKLENYEYWALVAGAVAVFIWWLFRNATYGNLLLQPGAIIGYIPTWKSVWKNSKNEKPLPWLIWSAMGVVQIIIVLLRWKGQYQDLVGPISGALTCASVPILTLRKTQNPQ